MSEEQPRILILSSRLKNNFAYNSCLFEFEDIITEVDNVNLVNLASSKPLEKLLYKVVKKTSQYIPNCTHISPPLAKKLVLDREYDIVLIILDFPYHILNINLLKQWRKKCKIAVCYLVELWQTEFKKYKNHLAFLENFDLVFLGHSQIIEQAETIIQKPCFYLAPGIDTLKFYPQNIWCDRPIDLTSMGRRSPITHQALLNLTQNSRFFYYYDLLFSSEQRIDNHQTHRILNANILKHSRYFIVNQAKVDCLAQTGGQAEIGYRFFEGAAAGTVMLGSPPNNRVFSEYFAWKNAIIPINFDEPDIAQIIAKLDSSPELLLQICQDNIINSLLQHDWVYRWQTVLEKTGITPSQKLIQRKHHLQQLATSLMENRHFK